MSKNNRSNESFPIKEIEKNLSDPNMSEKNKMIALIMKLDNKVNQYQEETNKTMAKIEQVHQCNNDTQSMYRQELLHMETVNMMSKYQIVYQRMESVLSMMVDNATMRSEKQSMRRAFNIMRDRARVHKIAQSYTKKLIFQKMKDKLQNLALKQSGFKQVAVIKAFQKWRLQTMILNRIQGIKSEKGHQIEAIQIDLKHMNRQKNDLSQEMQELGQELENDDDLIQQREKKIEKLNQTLSQLPRPQSSKQITAEAPESAANSAHDGHSSRVNLDSDPLLDQQLQQLKNKIRRMQTENDELEEKIKTTNDGISIYINEMSSMLDSTSTGFE